MLQGAGGRLHSLGMVFLLEQGFGFGSSTFFASRVPHTQRENRRAVAKRVRLPPCRVARRAGMPWNACS